MVSNSVIDPKAEIDPSVEIGPFCVIGPNVKIGANTKLHSHVVIDGHTTIGEGNTFYPFCSIGAPPQDLSYKGEDTEVIIGNHNIFRESCTVHRATTKQDLKTIIGNESLFMAYVHLGHDVVVGDKCVFANTVNLAGHVQMGDRVIIGGTTAIGQFVRVGSGVFLSGLTGVDRDIPPYSVAQGERATIRGLNLVGLKRNGYDKKDIFEALKVIKEIEKSDVGLKTGLSRDEFKDVVRANSILFDILEFCQNSKSGVAGLGSSRGEN
jgi:UDP-N-acetylglucosamine acyltransferase